MIELLAVHWRSKRTAMVALFLGILVVLAATGVAYALTPREVTRVFSAAVETAGGAVQFVTGGSAFGLSLLGSVVGGGSPPDSGPLPPQEGPTSGPSPTGGNDGATAPTPPGSGSPQGSNDFNEISGFGTNETSGFEANETSGFGTNETGLELENDGPSGVSTTNSTFSPPSNETSPAPLTTDGPSPPPFFTPAVSPSSSVNVTGLVARPGPNPGEIRLTWSPAPVTTYAVYRGVTPDLLEFLTLVGAANFTDEGLVPGATYYYAVAALKDGVPGPRTSTVSSVAQADGSTTIPTPELPTLALGATGLGLLAYASRRRG